MVGLQTPQRSQLSKEAQELASELERTAQLV
jgi:hypothetical protein